MKTELHHSDFQIQEMVDILWKILAGPRNLTPNIVKSRRQVNERKTDLEQDEKIWQSG